jgi:uncharacterized protein (DUF1330 family)
MERAGDLSMVVRASARWYNGVEATMKKAYWVVSYREVRDGEALQRYAALAPKAIEAAGGKVLVRTAEVHAFDAGLQQRTVVVEFESLQKALDARESAAYGEALRALGSATDRDFRIVEGV